MEATVAGQLCSEQVEKIKKEILDSFSANILPTILQDIAPTIRESLESDLIPMLKREIVEASKGVMLEIREEITNEIHWRQFSQLDVDRFLEKHCELLNKYEGLRDNALRKAKRLENLLNLYYEQLNASPIYVPRKFRKDKYTIKSSSELEVLKNREINDFKSEMEIMRLRLLENQKRVQHQDDLFLIFLNENEKNSFVKNGVINIWNKNNKEESDRLDKMWERKIKEMKIAYSKDKDFIRNHNSKRFKQSNDITLEQAGMRASIIKPSPPQYRQPQHQQQQNKQQNEHHPREPQRQQPYLQQPKQSPRSPQKGHMEQQQQPPRPASEHHLVVESEGLEGPPNHVTETEELGNIASPEGAASVSNSQDDSSRKQLRQTESVSRVEQKEVPAGIVLEDSQREFPSSSRVQFVQNAQNQQTDQSDHSNIEDTNVYEQVSEVEDEDFEDSSQVLFPDTLDKKMVELLAGMEYSEDEESDEEVASGNHFRRNYDLRNRPLQEPMNKETQQQQQQSYQHPKRKKSWNQLTRTQYDPKSSTFQNRSLRGTR